MIACNLAINSSNVGIFLLFCIDKNDFRTAKVILKYQTNKFFL